MTANGKCWLCFNQTRKYQKHNSMFGKKREFNISDRYPFPTFTFTPELKGHQSSGARAPELWCPRNLFGVFLVVYPQCCWQYSDITRKRQEHINTLGIKDKLIFLMFIHEITIKNPVNLKGHKTSGAQAPEIWCCIFLLHILILAGSVLIKSGNVRNT